MRMVIGVANAYSLENLLSADVLQSTVQILDLLDNIIELAFIRTLNGACGSYSHIQREFDAIWWLTAAQPAAANAGVGESEADAVVSRIGCGKGELAVRIALLGNNSMVVVEGFFDGNVYADACMYFVGVCLLVELFGLVVTCNMSAFQRGCNGIICRQTDNQSVLRQLLEETLRRCSIHVKVKRIGR